MVIFLLRDHAAVQASNPIIAPSFDRTHGPSSVFTVVRPILPFVVIRFVGGLLLFFLSKPLGKLVARGLE